MFDISILSQCRISQNAGDSRPRVTLVGLFPLHQNSPDKMCNKIVSVKNYNGYQRMEAFVLALEKVNNQQFYKSDVFLEAILYDTCSDPLAEYVNYAKEILSCGHFTFSPLQH